MDFYDPRQLDAFLAVAQTKSFTKAADRLGVRQSTVSQQVRKLETCVGRVLFHRDTHRVELTTDGETMIGFARSILTSHQRATSYFNNEQPRGRLRLGMSDDLALSELPRILRDFRRSYTDVELELTVDRSDPLERRLESGKLDAVLGRRLANSGSASPSAPGTLHIIRRESAVWVAAEKGSQINFDRPIPLIVYRSPSVSRTAMLDALERANIPWRLTCVCRGVTSLIGAVAAGVGISSLSKSLVPLSLSVLSEATGLPQLGDFELVLIVGARGEQSPAMKALVRAVLGRGSLGEQAHLAR